MYDVRVSPEIHDQLINQVCLRVYRDRSIKYEGSFDAVAQKLTAVVRQVIKGNDLELTDSVLSRWLKAEAVQAFVMSRIRFAHDQILPGVDPHYRSSLNEPEKFMLNPVPRAVCSGSTRLAMKLSQLMGLTCYHIDGFTQQKGRTDWSKPNHGWVLYDLGDGVRVPCDVTHNWSDDVDFSKLDRKVGWEALIRTVRDWEVFLFRYYQYRLASRSPEPQQLSLMNTTFAAWCSVNQNPEILQRYFQIYNSYEARDRAQIEATR